MTHKTFTVVGPPKDCKNGRKLFYRQQTTYASQRFGYYIQSYIKHKFRGWRIESDLMSTCSYREHGFDSHHPPGQFQLSVTPSVGDLTHFSDLHGYKAYMWYTATHVGKHSYTLNDKFKIKNILSC